MTHTLLDEPKEICLALNIMLNELINPQHNISLERLQLVSVEIEKIDEARLSTCQLRNISLKKNAADNLSLSGELVGENGKAACLKINYFVRGQRKYLKPQSVDNSKVSKESLGKISVAMVQNFFKSLGTDNDFFYNKDLAQLNGHQNIQVPAMYLVYRVLSELPATIIQFTTLPAVGEEVFAFFEPSESASTKVTI